MNIDNYMNNLENSELDWHLSQVLDKYQDKGLTDFDSSETRKKVIQAIETLRDHLGFYKIRSEYEGE